MLIQAHQKGACSNLEFWKILWSSQVNLQTEYPNVTTLVAVWQKTYHNQVIDNAIPLPSRPKDQ
jgi:hypothetical protein